MKVPSEYDFEQMLAEAVTKLGTDRVLQCIDPLARLYGWPIPADKRAIVGAAVVELVRDPMED